MRRVPLTVALGLAVVLGVAALAYADGATDNTAAVDGSLKPRKLDKKEYKPIALFTEVRTEGAVTGNQENPEKELIEFDRDGAWKSKPQNFDLGYASAITTTDAPCPQPTSATLAPARNFSSTPSRAGIHSVARLARYPVRKNHSVPLNKQGW